MTLPHTDQELSDMIDSMAAPQLRSVLHYLVLLNPEAVQNAMIYVQRPQHFGDDCSVATEPTSNVRSRSSSIKSMNPIDQQQLRSSLSAMSQDGEMVTNQEMSSSPPLPPPPPSAAAPTTRRSPSDDGDVHVTSLPPLSRRPSETDDPGSEMPPSAIHQRHSVATMQNHHQRPNNGDGADDPLIIPPVLTKRPGTDEVDGNDELSMTSTSSKKLSTPPFKPTTSIGGSGCTPVAMKHKKPKASLDGSAEPPIPKVGGRSTSLPPRPQGPKWTKPKPQATKPIAEKSAAPPSSLRSSSTGGHQPFQPGREDNRPPKDERDEICEEPKDSLLYFSDEEEEADGKTNGDNQGPVPDHLMNLNQPTSKYYEEIEGRLNEEEGEDDENPMDGSLGEMDLFDPPEPNLSIQEQKQDILIQQQQLGLTPQDDPMMPSKPQRTQSLQSVSEDEEFSSSDEDEDDGDHLGAPVTNVGRSVPDHLVHVHQPRQIDDADSLGNEELFDPPTPKNPPQQQQLQQKLQQQQPHDDLSQTEMNHHSWSPQPSCNPSNNNDEINNHHKSWSPAGNTDGKPVNGTNVNNDGPTWVQNMQAQKSKESDTTSPFMSIMAAATESEGPAWVEKWNQNSISDGTTDRVTLDERMKREQQIQHTNQTAEAAAEEEEEGEIEKAAAAVAAKMGNVELQDGKNSSHRPSLSEKFPPSGACYLVYHPVEALLNIHYSEVPIDGVVGVWTSPNIEAFKSSQGLGQCVLIGNCASGVHDRRNYYDGWCQFVRAAKSMNATVTVLDVGVPVDFYTYNNGKSIKTGKVFETEMAEAVACLPKNNNFYNNLVVDIETWIVQAKEIGAVVTFPTIGISTPVEEIERPPVSPAGIMEQVESAPFEQEEETEGNNNNNGVGNDKSSSSNVGEVPGNTSNGQDPMPLEAPTTSTIILPTAPTQPGGACYLVYEPDSSGNMVLHYSKTPIGHAIGMWVPGKGKKITGFKFTQNLGRSILIGNCASGVQGRKNYCSGWCQFVRAAKLLYGTVVLWDPISKGLNVDVWVYHNTRNSQNQSEKLLPGVPMNVESILAVACLPKHTKFFDNLAVDLVKWMTEANNIGAASKF